MICVKLITIRYCQYYLIQLLTFSITGISGSRCPSFIWSCGISWTWCPSRPISGRPWSSCYSIKRPFWPMFLMRSCTWSRELSPLLSSELSPPVFNWVISPVVESYCTKTASKLTASGHSYHVKSPLNEDCQQIHYYTAFVSWLELRLRVNLDIEGDTG